MIATDTTPFALQRLGLVMTPDPDDPREAWGVLNPGGVRAPDGTYTLFPRLAWIIHEGRGPAASKLQRACPGWPLAK